MRRRGKLGRLDGVSVRRAGLGCGRSMYGRIVPVWFARNAGRCGGCGMSCFLRCLD